MGTTFLGCHAGPRLSSKKDRDSHAEKQGFADKGKFINKKKARPESDYRRADDEEERIAKSDPKSKPKAKASDAIRKPSNTDTGRIVATRKPAGDEPKSAPRSTNAAPAKTTKPADQPQVARREPSRRRGAGLFDDSIFEDVLPEQRLSAPAATARKGTTKPAAAVKARPADEDPFKKLVTTSSNVQRPNDKVAKAKFNDDGLDLGLDDEELQEEAEELVEAKALAAPKNAAMKKVVAPVRDPRATPAAATVQRKYLDGLDELETDEPGRQVAAAKEKVRASLPTVKRAADTATTIAGQEVIDRSQTASHWRRDLERDELAEPEQEPVDSAPRASARPSNSNLPKGDLSPADLDEFGAPPKAQGAVFNGELIIDTNNLPSRILRSSSTPSGTNGDNGSSRINSNSGASVEIAPGAMVNRPRPAGQISLQSMSDVENASGLMTADYVSSSDADELGDLPSLKMESELESEADPKLASLDVTPKIAPPPPNIAELVPAIGAAALPSSGRGRKRTLLVLSAMVSALGIGYTLRRRSELEVVTISGSSSGESLS
jgi:hypothetical protein